MTQHYFNRNPETESQPGMIKTTVRGQSLILKTDAGVFSKNMLDFGSRTLLEAFEEPTQVKGSILDMGCGYGPIGITLGKLYPNRSVTMVDVNERAIQLAKTNIELNEFEAEVFYSDLFENVHGSFAIIVTNPPIRAGKDVVYHILEKAYDYLEENGELWIVIQKKQGAPSAIKKLKEIYQEVEVKRKNKGYYVICAKR